MNSSGKDYIKLYQLQDKFLSWWQTLDFPFYLTGGTALGRFYLNHRFSEDLDFFVKANPLYNQYISDLINKIKARYQINLQQSLFADDFSRIFINENDIQLKIEFVNDSTYYVGKPAKYIYGNIDTPLNILSNKITALVGRDEPKDIFDIIHLSMNYSFNWMEVFSFAKQKALINELDVEQRLISFPLEWLENVNWLFSPVKLDFVRRNLLQIADDFLLGKMNSLGKHKIAIEKAVPVSLK